MSGNLDTFVACGFIKKEETSDDLSQSDTALEEKSDNDAEEIGVQGICDGEFVLAEPETSNLPRQRWWPRVNKNDLKAALKDLKEGTLNFSQASRKYRISATSLSAYFRRSQNKSRVQRSAPGAKPFFTMEQETLLTKYIKSKRGNTKLSHRAFRRLVWLLGEKLECNAQLRSRWMNGECSYQWARAFFFRHNLDQKQSAKAKADNAPIDDNMFSDFLNNIPTKMWTNQESKKNENKMSQTVLTEQLSFDMDTTDKNLISGHGEKKTGKEKNMDWVLPSNLCETEKPSAQSSVYTSELPTCSKDHETSKILVKLEPFDSEDISFKIHRDNLIDDKNLLSIHENEQNFHTIRVEQCNNIEKELNLLQLSKFNSHFKKFTRNNQCNKCSQLFTCQEQLNLHLFDEPAHLTCKTCRNTFNNLKHLESDKRLQHLQNHCMQCDPPKPPRKQIKREYPCEGCGRTWNFEKCYLRHVYGGKCEGRPTEASSEAVKGGDAFICKHCSEEFKHITSFLEHLTLHE